MGKVEDMRALRAQIRDELARIIPDPPPGVRPASELPAPADVAAGVARRRASGQRGQRATMVVVDEAAEFDLCGHTAIGGKRCSRPKDHPEKNHRYPKTEK